MRRSAEGRAAANDLDRGLVFQLDASEFVVVVILIVLVVFVSLTSRLVHQLVFVAGIADAPREAQKVLRNARGVHKPQNATL